ncbi:MAG: hypothetical protein JWO86_3366 [Myxococcaceae bacterium]|nr:hypothetical protein [Myxococcaceae bacterium]
MRDPEAPEGPKTAETAGSATPTGTSGVSIPDRRRIDSDVRAFLREPSTPWIVFDQEGRPPSQLAVGEILRGPRRTLLSDYDFSATAAVDFASTHARISEPSSLAVSSDLASAAAAAPSPVFTDVSDDAEASELVAPRMFGLHRHRRVLGASAGAVALVSMLAVGIFALRGATHDALDAKTLRSVAAAQPAAVGAPPIDLSPQPAVAPPPVVPIPVAQAAVVSTPVVPTPVAQAPAAPPPFAVTIIPPKTDAKGGKYGRLTIAGDARAKDVFFDGKRMLGRGQRSFSVMCGTHTISVNVRNDAHEVEIPCNAELVVGK